MLKNFTNKKEVVAAIIDASLRSAKAKEVNIFEIGNLNELLPMAEAESIRKEFVAHNTPIKQITNHRKFTSWTTNSELIQQNLKVKYVSPDNFAITNEILIFDDVVCIYRLLPTPLYIEIQDSLYAESMRRLFLGTWQMGDALLLAEDGSTLTKQYLPLSFTAGAIPVVAYPAKDDGRLENAFPRNKPGMIERYVTSLLKADTTYFKDADMVLAYVWNQGQTPCCDVWKIMRNGMSDDSGFLYDMHVYKGTTITPELGVASGNSSIVITAEEMLLRELILKEKLSFTDAADRTRYPARFPMGYVPGESFYR
ncbi:MAG TPA: hypothetical protein VLG11_01935 [Candidatus Saccharimonadales bacterium]|nr:hypothetical protein [Candidatus Saccharimonadales bacterium]